MIIKEKLLKCCSPWNHNLWGFVVVSLWRFHCTWFLCSVLPSYCLYGFYVITMICSNGFACLCGVLFSGAILIHINVGCASTPWPCYDTGDCLLILHNTLIARFMGPTWDRQDPGGPHVGHMNFAIWVGTPSVSHQGQTWLLSIAHSMVTDYISQGMMNICSLKYKWCAYDEPGWNMILQYLKICNTIRVPCYLWLFKIHVQYSIMNYSAS